MELAALLLLLPCCTLQPKIMSIAVMLGASAAFISPFGYQCKSAFKAELTSNSVCDELAVWPGRSSAKAHQLTAQAGSTLQVLTYRLLCADVCLLQAT